MGALVSGCFVDLGGSSGSASATTTASSSDATSAANDSSTSPDPTTTTSTLESTSEPTGPTCQPAGGVCSSNDAPCCGCLHCENGTCVQGACEACHHCTDDGSCAPDEPGTACTGPEDLCPTLAFGFVDGTCHAYAPAGATCDDTATCVPGQCTAKGAEHIKCPECHLPMPDCFAGLPLSDITLADVCQTSGTTAQCTTNCSNASTLVANECNDLGQCSVLGVLDCIPYSCDAEASACKTSCASDIDCNNQFTCNDFGECQ